MKYIFIIVFIPTLLNAQVSTIYGNGHTNIGSNTLGVISGTDTIAQFNSVYRMKLRGLVLPPSTYNLLVHGLTDSGVYQIPSSTFATGNTLYTGDGTVSGNRDVNLNNLNLTFSDANTFRINYDTYVQAKADGTFPYTNVITAPGQQLWMGYTPTAGTFSKGSGIVIDTNNNVSIGTSTPPTTAPLYADGAAYLHGLQSGRGNFYRVSDFSADHTMTNAEYWANIDASGGNVVITLPAASSVFGSSMGIQYVFRRTDNTGNTVTIQRNGTPGTDTINGATSFTLTTQYEVKEVQCVSTSAFAIK
jgi:hypothetical protein